MQVTDVLNKPWAILPAKLLEIQEIYAAHLRGEVIDIEAVEARIGKPLSNQQQGYAVQNGIAVLPISGVIAKRMNMLMEIFGGTSTQLAGRDFQAALSDPEVREIILLIDSPGGEVDGVEQLGNMIAAARGVKPVTALIDGMGASAGYWLASAASKVYITGQTTVVGSIGVVATHRDFSQRDAKEGVITTEVTAGRYKRIASENAPLTEEGRQTIQDQVDAIYGVFVDAVAKNRGVSAGTVLKNMADGKIFIGKQAINAGLVDGIATLPQLISSLSKQSSGASLPTPTTAISAPSPQVAAKEIPAQSRKEPEPQHNFSQQRRKKVDVQSVRKVRERVSAALSGILARQPSGSSDVAVSCEEICTYLWDQRHESLSAQDVFDAFEGEPNAIGKGWSAPDQYGVFRFTFSQPVASSATSGDQASKLTERDRVYLKWITNSDLRAKYNGQYPFFFQAWQMGLEKL